MSSKSKAEKQAALAKPATEKKVTAKIPTPEEQAAEAAAAEKAKKKAEKEAKAAEPKKPGKIAQILEHFKAGKSLKEIAALKDVNDGLEFSPITISIQVSKFKKKHPELYPPVVRATKEEKDAAKAAKAAEKQAAKDAAKAEKEAAKAKDQPVAEAATV